MTRTRAGLYRLRRRSSLLRGRFRLKYVSPTRSALPWPVSAWASRSICLRASRSRSLDEPLGAENQEDVTELAQMVARPLQSRAAAANAQARPDLLDSGEARERRRTARHLRRGGASRSCPTATGSCVRPTRTTCRDRTTSTSPPRRSGVSACMHGRHRLGARSGHPRSSERYFALLKVNQINLESPEAARRPRSCSTT